MTDPRRRRPSRGSPTRRADDGADARPRDDRSADRRARRSASRRFEGPRRRARREREERRAAQARATAIEQARREAKRRAQRQAGRRVRKPLARGAVRGLKVVMWTVAAQSSLVVGLGLLLYFTPVMSARNVVDHRARRGDAGRGHRRGGGQAGHAAAADQHRRRRRAGGRDPPGRQRAGAAGIPVDAADHGRRAGARRGQGLSRRPAPVRPRRRGFRDRAAAARACRTSTPTTPGPSDPPTKAALQVMTALRPEVAGQVGRVAAPSVAVDHADADRRPGGGVGDHRPHRGEGAEAGGAADPAGPDLRRVQPGSADGQVVARRRRNRAEIRSRCRRRACMDTRSTSPYRSVCAEQLDITLSLWLRLRVCQERSRTRSPTREEGDR